MTSRLLTTVFAALLAATPGLAFEVPDHGPLQAKEFRHPNLWWGSAYRSVPSMPAEAAREFSPTLTALAVQAENAWFDLRTGRWGTLVFTRPIIPGSGVGNQLQWSDLDRPAPRNVGETRQAAWDAFRGFLAEYAADLRFDTAEFGDPTVSLHGGRLIQIYLPRQHHGVPIRDSFITAAINSGNLVLMGQRNWADIDLETRPAISGAQAEEVLRTHLDEISFERFHEAPRLEIVPVSDQPDEDRLETVGDGLDYRLVWVLSPVIEGDIGVWEALVDAHGGELLAFQDTVHYASRRVSGGVYPVSNDGQPPDGVEQPDWPMPFANISVDGTPEGFTTTGGNVPAGVDTGTISTTLNGQYVRMDDTCGAINESSASDDLELGDGPGTDCDVPPGASPGNTHASRSGFYELNRIIEQGRGYLPGNSWLNGQLQATMNVNDVCNAGYSSFFGVRFFKSGTHPNTGLICANTGEIAAVFDHEWGHGMDDHDGNPSVSSPGESIADIYAQNRLNDSCIGRGFRSDANPNPNCDGFGDACLECTGVRESDWSKRQSGQPHDVSWVQANCPATGTPGPCGLRTHCEGNIVAEASWDLVHRDLQGFDGSAFNYDSNTALELGTRLAYYGSHTVGDWYQCVTDGTAGCNADGGYLNYLAANDDNGDLTDGTPHMSAIFAAFDRHGIACPTPAVQDAGCSGGPQAAPQNVTATSMDEGAELSWDAVPDAGEYWIFRTEGVHGCDFGKSRIGTTSDTSFIEEGLRNEFEVFYSVVAVGTNDACTSPMSACAPVTPLAGPTGTIEGTVTRAATGIPLAGAVVEGTGPTSFDVVTDASGEYQVTALTGNYDLTVSRAGHGDATAADVAVAEDAVVTLDFALDTPVLEASPPMLEFEAPQNGIDSGTLEIANIGSLDLSWDAATASDCTVSKGADWLSAAPASGLTPPAGGADVTVIADAAGLGPGVYEAELCLTTNDFEASLVPIPAQLTVTEMVAGELALDPAALDLGEATVGGTAVANLSVGNTAPGDALPIELSAIEVTLGDDVFGVTGGECAAGTMLEAGEECQVEVSFSPAALQAYTGEITVSTVEGQSVTVSLAGLGVQDPGELEVTPVALDFGNVVTGGSGLRNITVSNIAAEDAAELEFTQFEVIAGQTEFTIDPDGSDCGDTLAAQQSCTVAVTFTPVAETVYSGVLRIVADGDVINVTLSGSGLEPSPEVFEDRFELQ